MKAPRAFEEVGEQEPICPFSKRLLVAGRHTVAAVFGIGERPSAIPYMDEPRGTFANGAVARTGDIGSGDE